MMKMSVMFVMLSFAPMSLVYGVGIGDLLVHSHLDQPFRAQVLLQDIGELNVEQMRVKLASLEDFEKAEIDFSDFLANLTFKIIKNAQNDLLIQIKSDLPVQDPYLAFILQISWGSGHILKEFSALMDPIELQPVPVPVLEPQLDVLAEPALFAESILEPRQFQAQSIKPLPVVKKETIKPALKQTVESAKKPLELLSANVVPENLNMNQRLVMIEEILDTLTQNNRMLKEKQTEYKAENESLVALLKIKEQEIMSLTMLAPRQKPVNLLSIVLTGMVLGCTVMCLIFMMRLKKNKIKTSQIIT